MMDEVTIVMFTFSLIIGLIFFVLAFRKLEEAIKADSESKTQLASASAGTIYFLISMSMWLAMGLYWPAVATDAVLVSLGWMLLAFAVLSFACVFGCIGFIIRASVKRETCDMLEIREEE